MWALLYPYIPPILLLFFLAKYENLTEPVPLCFTTQGTLITRRINTLTDNRFDV